MVGRSGARTALGGPGEHGVNEPIEVDARFEADGTIQPLAFTWKGKLFPITAQGRRWDSGGQKHFLVMTGGDQAFELAFLPEESRWELLRSPQQFQARRRTA